MRPFASCFLSQRASLLAAALLTVPVLHAAPVVISGVGTYTQNFDTLPTADTPWVDDSILPGWYAAPTTLPVSPKVFTMFAGTGSSNTGGIYSFGSASSTDRAFGSVGSGTPGTLYYGVAFQNTGSTEEEIDSFAYTGEQWRDGGNPGFTNSLKLEYLVTSDAPSVGAGTTGWIEIPSLKFTSLVQTAATGVAIDGNAAADRTALSATSPGIYVPAGQYVTFRWTDINDSGSDHGLAVDDLTATWKVSTGDHAKPLVTELSPAKGATNASADFATALVMTFNENVQPGTGNIVLKKADGTLIYTFPVADSSYTVFSGNTVSFSHPDLSTILAKNTSYYVEVPSTAIKDLASTPNFFAGFTGPTGWNFSTPTPAAPTVVINKYSVTTDEIELLVVGTGAPGSLVDLRGMILKDFSASLASDGGGSFTFTDADIWNNVRAGTLIDLPLSAASVDVTATGSDYNLTVGLQDPTYFTAGSGTYDISSSDMVMIKASGSPIAGTAGGIHALAGAATPGPLYIDFPGAKVVASGGSSNIAVINSSTPPTVADFMSDLSGGQGASGNSSDFGSPNTPGNALFISNLRGIVAGNGDGIATVTNLTGGSIYNGSGVFDASQTGQTAQITLNAYTAGVTLNKVTVVVPATLGTPGTVTLSGTGSTGATFTQSGSTITITGAAVTGDNPLNITIGGLITPAAPTGVTDTGNFDFVVSTSTSTGTLSPLMSEPAVIVPIPIASLRDVDANGVPLDANETVAVTGVVTEDNFNTSTTQISAFIQDSSAGISVFSPATALGLVRGSRYTIVGKIVQFNGVTELVPSSVANVVSLGIATEVAPQVVTLTALLAEPEKYEGSLVTVQGLTRKTSDTTLWGTGSTITEQDSGGNAINVYIQQTSTATTEPDYPADFTGILGQHDSTSPYTSSYELYPRTQDDLSSGTTPPTNSYSTWATANGITGEAASADHDKDGLTNLLEYALGLNPTVSNGSPGVFNAATKTITFTKGTEAVANADVTYAIQTSPDLVTWTTVTATTNDATSISYTLPAGTKLFARLQVAQAP